MQVLSSHAVTPRCSHGEGHVMERRSASARCGQRSLVDHQRGLSWGHRRSQMFRDGRSRPSVCGVSLRLGALRAGTQTAGQ